MIANTRILLLGILVLFAVAEARRQRVPRGCKYSKGNWTDCDIQTNTQSRELTLRKGPDHCPTTQDVQRECKSVCRYSRGQWSECDPITNMKARNDTLKNKSKRSESCDSVRVITKKCKKRCKYTNDGDWSECDKETNEKTRIAKLRDGDPAQCEPTKVSTKPCKKGGCKFGRWSTWSECTDGKKSKVRQLLDGDLEKCERKTKKEKRC